MKASKWFISVAVLLMLVVLMDNAMGQAKRVGTASASQLLIPIGARDMALGGSSIANSKGLEAMYWNPAGLGRMHNSAEGMFSSMSYIADIGVDYAAVAGSFESFGVLGLSITSMDFGDIPLTTEADPENESGRFFSPAFVTVNFGFARGITDAIAAGINLKLVSEQIERVSASAFAIDIGVQYSGLVGVKGLQLGVVVKNIGPQMQYGGSGLYHTSLPIEGLRPSQRFLSEAASFELPSVIEIGLSYEGSVENNIRYGLNSVFSNNSLYYDEYKVGAELGYVMESFEIFGRFGMGMVPEISDAETHIFGESFGAGIHWNAPGVDITVDYAFRSAEFFDGNNVFSVKFGF
jgi:hypothetical protein